jgi:hypothetical protein
MGLMTKRRPDGSMQTRSLLLTAGPRTLARAVYEAARGIDGVLFSHVGEDFVGFRLGKSWDDQAWIETIIRPADGGTSVRVVARLDPEDAKTSASGVEQAKTGVSLVIRALENAERRYTEDPGSG